MLLAPAKATAPLASARGYFADLDNSENQIIIVRRVQEVRNVQLTGSGVGGRNMTPMEVSKARKELSDTLNRVAYRGERIVLRRRGKNVAAIVPLADLKLIERLEDEIDVREARKALKEPTVPWEKFKAKRGY